MRFSFPISIFCSLLLAASIITPVWGMNKAELIDAIASSSGLSKADSKRALEGLLHGIEFGLQDFSRNNGSVYISGFGAFVRTTNEICDSKDDDCNGRFLCNSTLPDPRGARDVSIACGGSVCNGVDDLSRGVSSEICTNGVDDDCDLLVDDDDDSLSTLSTIDFELDEMGDESEFGKFYYNYWTEVVLTLANDLDNLANKSYIIAPNPLQSDNSVISEGNSSPEPGTTYKGDFMNTVVYWMTTIRDYLDPDSDDDGIIDAMRKACKCRGHVTVLKFALTQGDLVEQFGEHAGLSLDLTTYVKDFLLEAVHGLEIMNNPLNPLVDNTDAILAQMAYEISRAQVDNIGFRQQFGPVQQQRNRDGARKLNPTAYHPPLRRELDPQADGSAVLDHEEASEKSKRALDAFISATTNALKKGDRISLIGFGSFSVSKRAARTGRNPQTGKAIKIAAKKVVKFKAGADLAKKVN